MYQTHIIQPFVLQQFAAATNLPLNTIEDKEKANESYLTNQVKKN